MYLYVLLIVDNREYFGNDNGFSLLIMEIDDLSKYSAQPCMDEGSLFRPEHVVKIPIQSLGTFAYISFLSNKTY